ncbi:MAG: phosphatase PAP2 family protein [Nanoarchaeota archaeon]|nr:phosphatase PAP2 family protein [Nanoarchaeota archaeon]
MSIKSFWKSSLTNKLILIVLLIWILLAVVFGIYDQQISEFLFNPDSSIGNIVDSFGEIPGALFIIFSLFVLNTNAKIRNQNYKKLFFMFEILLSSFLFIYILNLFFDFFKVSFNFFSLEGMSVLFLFVLVSLLGFYTFKLKFKKFSQRNYFVAKVSILLFVIAGLIVQALKLFWGRVRYEDVANNLGAFTSWYIPQGIGVGHSFPSGHVFFALVLIPIFLIFADKKRIWKVLTIVLSILFGLFISLGRIISGAHYASDVLFSGGITVITFLILYRKNFEKKKSSPTTKKKKIKNKK